MDIEMDQTLHENVEAMLVDVRKETLLDNDAPALALPPRMKLVSSSVDSEGRVTVVVRLRNGVPCSKGDVRDLAGACTPAQLNIWRVAIVAVRFTTDACKIIEAGTPTARWQAWTDETMAIAPFMHDVNRDMFTLIPEDDEAKYAPDIGLVGSRMCVRDPIALALAADVGRLVHEAPRTVGLLDTLEARVLRVVHST